MVILIIFALLAASVVIYALYLGITPNWTNKKVGELMMAQIPRSTSGVMIDLGSGWGTLLSALSKQFPDNAIIGYELSVVPYLFSKVRCLFDQSKLSIYWRNFYFTPISDASVILCYLYPKGMQRLKDKFEQELKPGTLIITHTFAIPGWVPERTLQVNDLYHTKIFVYQVPERKKQRNRIV